MALSGGWIKSWRAKIHDGLWRSMTHPQKTIWDVLLHVANHEAAEFTCRKCGRTINVPAGATAISQRELARLADVPRSSLRRALEKFEKHGSVKVVSPSVRTGPALDPARKPALNPARKAAHCHSVIILTNWSIYQDGADQPGPQTGPKPGPQTGPKPGPDVRREEEEEEKKTTTARGQLTLEEDRSEEIARSLHEALRRAGHINGRRNLKAWANDLRKLHEIDGYSWDVIAEVCAWFPLDRHDGEKWGGWCNKIPSPAVLRQRKSIKKGDDRQQFEKILTAMREEKAHRGRAARRDPNALPALDELL
jgi:hypothetical protein